MPVIINGSTGISGIAFDTVNVSANLTVTNTFSVANIAAGSVGNSFISNGFSVIAFNAGANVAVYGTWTPNPSNGNYQIANSNGSFTLSAPVRDCAMEVLFSNGLGLAGNGAGSVTFSGFKVQSGGTGDSYTTTANNQYILTIKRLNGISTYLWKALQ